MRLASVVTAAVLLVSATARTADADSLVTTEARVLMLRLEGVLTASRADAAKAGFTTASLGLMGGRERITRWLGVTEAVTIDSDRGPLGKDVLDALAGYTPTFLVIGPPDLVAALGRLPLSTRVRLEGLVRRGARTFY